MAVLARNRSTSTLEFYHTAMKLRKSLYFLMMRDFGTKDKVRNVSDFTKGMDKDDADAVTLVFERYHIRKINMYWPEWVIERIRDTTCKLIDDLVINIERARSIWPKMKAEYEERRGDKRRYDAQGIIQSTDKLFRELKEGICNGRKDV